MEKNRNVQRKTTCGWAEWNLFHTSWTANNKKKRGKEIKLRIFCCCRSVINGSWLFHSVNYSRRRRTSKNRRWKKNICFAQFLAIYRNTNSKIPFSDFWIMWMAKGENQKQIFHSLNCCYVVTCLNFYFYDFGKSDKLRSKRCCCLTDFSHLVVDRLSFMKKYFIAVNYYAYKVTAVNLSSRPSKSSTGTYVKRERNSFVSISTKEICLRCVNYTLPAW